MPTIVEKLRKNQLSTQINKPRIKGLVTLHVFGAKDYFHEKWWTAKRQLTTLCHPIFQNALREQNLGGGFTGKIRWNAMVFFEYCWNIKDVFQKLSRNMKISLLESRKTDQFSCGVKECCGSWLGCLQLWEALKTKVWVISGNRSWYISNIWFQMQMIIINLHSDILKRK